MEFSYTTLSKSDKGAVKAYLVKMTGLSRAQLTRLMAQHRETGRICDRRGGGPTRPFVRRYTAADVRLLADVDAALGQRCGPATRAVLRRHGVDPNSWTPDPLGRRYPPCRDQDRRIRRSFGARWLSWCEPDGVRKSCHESLSRRRRRSATGSCKPSVTRGVAGMGQVPRSERRCVAFAERFVGCAKNEISWQKPRLVAVHRRHILANDDRRARLQARRADRTLRILTTRDLMVSMIDEGLLDIAEADSIKDEWAARHRFRLKLDSFRDFYP